MADADSTYSKLLLTILSRGREREDRTGTGTTSVFAPLQMKFDVANGRSFPLLTTKKMAWKSIVAETLWFLQGRNDLASLRADGCTWWDEWEKEDGTIGPGYGYQLRHWKKADGSEFDQLAWVINEIKTNPTSRRLCMTMWNPADLDEMALPPCHGVFIQFYVDGEYLDLHMSQRSGDCQLGIPTNIAGYALVLMLVAQVVGKKAGYLTISVGDAHIYSNHMEQVREQLSRDVWKYDSPRVWIDPDITDIDDFRPEHIHLEKYLHFPGIKAPVSV